MKLQKFLIANGNPTLLVWEADSMQKKRVIKKYLGEVEQIGFANGYKLEMMGNELCINATLAFASSLPGFGELKTSGINEPVRFENFRSNSIIAKLPYKKIENIIIFFGIGFICSNEKKYRNKEVLSTLAKKYSLPAFGAVAFSKNKIDPWVYVKGTDSIFPESACGSGSIAYSIFSGFEKIIHPTGQSILVCRRGDQFTVSARVVKIGEEYES